MCVVLQEGGEGERDRMRILGGCVDVDVAEEPQAWVLGGVVKFVRAVLRCGLVLVIVDCMLILP